MTEPTEPFTVQQIVSTDKEFTADDGSITTPRDFIPDPNSEWHPGPLPDEPTPTTPPRTVMEAYAWAEARAAFWRAMMRAPYATRRQGRRRRPLRERDFIRRTDPDLVCESCKRHWSRERRGRGPIPRLCPDCRQVARNAH